MYPPLETPTTATPQIIYLGDLAYTYDPSPYVGIFDHLLNHPQTAIVTDDLSRPFGLCATALKTRIS